jgi:Concanavalin A-like lectin/glucanases superfamily
MLGNSHLSLFASDISIYDPYWGNTVLLMGFENNLADNSQSNQTVTPTGTPLYSTSTVKFGTYSVLLQGAAALNKAYLNIANTSTFYFGTGDFTIETWVNIPSGYSWGTNNVCVMDISQKQNGVNGGPSVFGLTTSSGSTVNAYKTFIYDNTAMGNVSSTQVLGSDTWNHIVTGRQAGTFYLGINGTLQIAGTSNKNWFPYSVKIKQDGYAENDYYTYFDEFRVTSGVWRYNGSTSTYTVPTAQFPRQ